MNIYEYITETILLAPFDEDNRISQFFADTVYLKTRFYPKWLKVLFLVTFPFSVILLMISRIITIAIWFVLATIIMFFIAFPVELYRATKRWFLNIEEELEL